MDLPTHETPPDSPGQRRADAARIRRALNASLAAVLLVLVAFVAQQNFDWRPLAIAPLQAQGLWGLLAAPLLHGSPGHVYPQTLFPRLIKSAQHLVRPHDQLTPDSTMRVQRPGPVRGRLRPC